MTYVLLVKSFNLIHILTIFWMAAILDFKMAEFGVDHISHAWPAFQKCPYHRLTIFWVKMRVNFSAQAHGLMEQETAEE